MKQARPYPQLIVTRKAARALAAGHPWVFEGEVLRIEPSPLDGTVAHNGCVVDVREENGTWQGSALLSQESKIRARIQVAADAPQAEVEGAAKEAVARFIEGKDINRPRG